MPKIISCVEIEPGQTYDIEVDHPDHQFYLSNGVLTSNSHAFAYAIDSYYCAYLQTHFESEWCCAYLESVSSSADKLAKAISEVKALGYKVGKLDVNLSTDGWTSISDQKIVVPSFLSCKGVGETAIEEILQKRPYKNIYDLLWESDGSWKHSKFNKKALESLIKVGGLDSLGEVGDGKTFKNYRHMHRVVIEHMDELKKSPKKDPGYGKRRLQELVEEFNEIEDWTRQEKLDMTQDLLGNFDISLILPQSKQEFLDGKGVKSIDHLHNGKDLAWFIVVEVQQKKTKNKKDYLMLRAVGDENKVHRIFLWGAKDPSIVPVNNAYISEVERSDFGLATNPWKLRKIESA